METKANNRTLSIVLKTLGVFLIAFFVIYVIGCGVNLWSAPRIHGLLTYLFVILSSGISLFLLGFIYNHKNNLDEKSMKLLKGLKGLFIIGTILLIVELMAVIPISIYDPIRIIFGIILGIAIYLVYCLKKRSSER